MPRIQSRVVVSKPPKYTSTYRGHSEEDDRLASWLDEVFLPLCRTHNIDPDNLRPRAHPTKKNMAECPLCKKQFDGLNHSHHGTRHEFSRTHLLQLAIHLKVAYKIVAKGTQVVCSDCKQGFSRTDSLRRHLGNSLCRRRIFEQQEEVSTLKEDAFVYTPPSPTISEGTRVAVAARLKQAEDPVKQKVISSTSTSHSDSPSLRDSSSPFPPSLSPPAPSPSLSGVMIAPSTAAIASATLTLNEISTTSPPYLYPPALLSNPTTSPNVSSHSPCPSTEFIPANPPSNQLDQYTNSPVSEFDDISRYCFRTFSDPSFSPYGTPAPQEMSTLTEMESRFLIDTRYVTQQSWWPQFYTAPVSWASGQVQPTQQNMNPLANPWDEQPLVDYDKWLVQ